MIRRIGLLAAVTLLAAACGNDDDDATARTTLASSTTVQAVSTMPVTTSPQTTAAPATPAPTMTELTTAVSIATTVPASCAAPPTFDIGSPLRDQFVTYLVGCGFTQAEGGCLFDHLDFSDPAVVAGDADAMLPAFQTCDIDASRMAEIESS